MRVSPDGWRYKVTPIDRVINDCRRRADDAWWDGNDDEARLHEQEQKLYEKDKRRVSNGFRTFRCSIPIGNVSGLVCRLCLVMDSTFEWKVKMERIRIRLSMMLHIGWVTYLVRILIAMSVLTNVILGGRLNQTFSARNWDWKRNNKPNLVRLLDALLGDGHCSRAWAYWKVRRKW